MRTSTKPSLNGSLAVRPRCPAIEVVADGCMAEHCGGGGAGDGLLAHECLPAAQSWDLGFAWLCGLSPQEVAVNFGCPPFIFWFLRFDWVHFNLVVDHLARWSTTILRQKKRPKKKALEAQVKPTKWISFMNIAFILGYISYAQHGFARAERVS